MQTLDPAYVKQAPAPHHSAVNTKTHAPASQSTLAAYIFFIIALFALALSPTVKASEGITVNSHGSAYAMPDIAKLTLSFEQNDDSADTARQAIDSKVKALLAKLSSFSLLDDSLDSSNTQVTPDYDYTDGKRTFKGYRVTRQVTFTLEDLTQLDALVQTLTSSKVTRLQNIVFDLKDSEEVQALALLDAIANSKKSAATVAKGYDIKLGKLKHARFNDSKPNHAPMARTMALDSAAEESSAGYQQKELEFKAYIEAVFELD
jgi:uncharacterized protein YggE